MKNTVLAVVLILVSITVTLFFIRPQIEQEFDPKTTSPAQHIKEARLYHYFSGTLSGGMAEMIAAVNKKDSDHKAQAHALDHEAFKSMILSTLTKDTPPELFTYWAGAKTQALVDQNKLEPIDDIWQATPFTDRFTTPVTEKASTYNNKRYLLPITEHSIVFFYNKMLFEQEGLSAPGSWPALVALADDIKTRGLIPFALGAKERWPAQFWFDFLLLRTAGPEYRQALMDNKAQYTDTEVHQVYAMWGKLLQKGYFNQNANELDWAEATSLVCSGQAAMTLMGTWAIPYFTGEKCGLAEESGFDFFVFPAITPKVPKVALGPVDGLVLTKGSANPDYARTILKYFAETEPQKRLSEASGAFAPSSLIPHRFYSPLRQRILKEIDDSPYWAFNYDLATMPEVADKGMDSFNEIIAFPNQGPEILKFLQIEVDKVLNSQ